MREAMQVTGLERGGIYRHFKSKEELAVAAFEFLLDNFMKMSTGGIEQIPTSLGKLRFTIGRFVELVSRMPGGCPLLNTAVDSDDGNAALRKKVRAAFSLWCHRLSTVIEEGIGRGEIRDDISSDMIASMVISSLEGALVLSRIQQDHTPLKQAEVMLNRMLLSISK